MVIGGGDTSPTMVTLHREWAKQAGAQPKAVIVETPYGFQENADQVSTKAQRYFAENVGLPTAVADGLRTPAEDTGPALDRGIAALRSADWVYIGPGSPSYALRELRESPASQALRDRFQRPGVTIYASAAACTLGRLTLPVYEIYKVGIPPRWLEGLDLLSELGLPVAVVPHFDNAEGGSHDTRYCLIGERRLRQLEEQLPDEAAIFGVDEHTAAVFDLEAETLAVRGRGGLTLRRHGQAQRVENGAELAMGELRQRIKEDPRPSLPRRSPPPRRPVPPAAARSLAEAARACEQAFDRALGELNAGEMVAAILELERTILAWATDTREGQDEDRARAVLRSLIVRLGEAASSGLEDPRAYMTPLVEPLLSLRQELRRDRRFELADALRSILTAAGIEIQDGNQGTAWSFRGTSN